MLLYTYISRFSVNPLSAEEKKSDKASAINFISQPLFIPFFNFSHKRHTFAFTGESGYTLGFRRRIAHSGLHGETRAFRMGVVSLPSAHSARSRTSPGRVSERQTLPLLSLGRRCSRRTQRACGTAMRLCASLFRGVAAPLGCAALFAI